MSFSWKKKSRSNQVIMTFSMASFLHDLGSDMISSVWPLFITNVLGANMAVLGLIDGLGEAMVSISQGVSGWLSDKLKKRKIFIWTGYMFGGLARVGYALAPTWQWLLPFRVLDRTGKMRGSPRDAILAELSDDSTRGSNFGFLRMMDNSGAVVGIVLALVLLPFLSYRTLFLLAALPSLAAAWLIFAKIREGENGKALVGPKPGFRHVRGPLILYFTLAGIFGLGSFTYSFLIIAAKEAGVAPLLVPGLYLLFTVIAAVFSLPFGRLADQIGRRPVLLFAFSAFACCCAIFTQHPSGLAIVIAMILYGVHKAAMDPVERTIVSELAPGHAIATTLGAYQMLMGLLALPASLIAGALWTTMGKEVTFAFSLILTTVAAILLLFLPETRRHT